jgi:acyl carrier protein
LTPNGKIDRQALPAPGIQQGKETYVTPRNQIEKTLAKIWAEVLGSPVPISIDDNFFDIGGHSLTAARLITRIHKELNTKIPLAKVFKTPTIRSISQYIKRTGQNIYASIPEVEKKEYYPVSSAQKRMFILHHLKGHDTSDNTPYAVMVEGKLDKEHLEQVVKQLIQRHEPLRTFFYLLDETPVQGVQPEVDFEIEYSRVEVKVEPGGIGDLPPGVGNIIKRFIRPFDLGKPPLLRVGLVQLSPQKYLFIHDIHHIIRDGTTSWIFIREFIELYKGNQLPELRIQYKGFTAWQNRMLESEVIKKQEAYWLEVFSEEAPVLNMPTDFPRPGVQSFEGDHIEFILDKEPSAKIRQLALAHGATLYMLLLAVYTILLSKYSGQEDIVVGTPIAGRPHADLENLIGMFVNTLAMRNYPTPMKTFAQFLKEVKDNALKAYDNQDYQFEVLVNRLGIAPDPARQSLFDTMFAVQNMAPGGPDSQNQLIKGLVFKRLKFEEKITQFDIMFHAIEREETISFRLLYCTRLFKEETIRLFIQNFKEIIGMVTNNKDIKLKDIAITHGLFNREIEVPEAVFEF